MRASWVRSDGVMRTRKYMIKLSSNYFWQERQLESKGKEEKAHVVKNYLFRPSQMQEKASG